MEATQFIELLDRLIACDEAYKWSIGKSLEEAWYTCERGDWMLWLYARSKNYDTRLNTLAKGLCAKTVIHLMKDERSTRCVNISISFGRGEATLDELNEAIYLARDAHQEYITKSYIVEEHVALALESAIAINAAGCAADAIQIATAKAHRDWFYERKENRMQTANICREVLPIPQF